MVFDKLNWHFLPFPRFLEGYLSVGISPLAELTKRLAISGASEEVGSSFAR